MADDASDYRELMAQLEAAFASEQPKSLSEFKGRMTARPEVSGEQALTPRAWANEKDDMASGGVNVGMGPVSGGVRMSADESGRPVNVGMSANAGPVGYQYSQYPDRRAAASGQHMFSLNIDPRDAAMRLQAILLQNAQGQRSYGVGTGGEGWGVQAMYDPQRSAAQISGGMQRRFARGGTVPGYFDGGSYVDPMGVVAYGDNADGREAGLYERLADDMAGAGMAVGEPIRQAVEGISDIPGSIGKYLSETAQKPDPSQRVAEDIQRGASAFAKQAMSSPTEFAKTVGGFIPGVGEAISAYDAKQLYGDLQKAEAEGDTGKADTLRQLYGLASAGAIPGIGIGARVAGKVARELSPLGFYSHGAESALGLPQAKGSPEQMAAMLQKYGVKPAELEGFGEAFAGRPSVTREEIAAHFKERMPQIEETVLGRDQLSLKERHRYYDLDDTVAKDGVNALSPEQQQEYYALQKKWNQEKPTKFSQYTLPGGENYREVRLTLPEGYGAPQQALDDLAAAKERASAASKAYNDALMAELDGTSKLSPEAFAALEKEDSIASSRVKNFEKLAKQPAFQSSHWPDAPNTVAHLRMADRTGPNGEKILHVEEIQSDWGQKGKKEGFQGKPPSEKDIEAKFVPPNVPEGHDPTNYPGYWESYDRRTGSFISRHRGGMNEQDVLSEAAKTADLGNRGLIPTAPYVTNTQAWTDLALKRALREAAEGGYDKLVWTPGAEQAKRYKLSNHINSIDYMREGEDAYRLGITNKRGEGIDLPKEVFTAKELEDYLGKEVAQKIVEDEGKAYRGRNHKTLEGLDLEVGGSGMKGYYDKIVPNQLSKLVKKLDPEAKIGRDSIQTQDTPRTMAYFLDWARAQGSEIPRPTLGQMWQNGANEPLVQQFMKETSGLEVPSLTITPKMREAILGGQTAFAEGGSVQDSGATEAADLDTLFQKYADPGYAMGGSVSPRAMANDNLVYDPDEIDAIAAQIRGAI